MEDSSRGRPPNRSGDPAKGAAGVRTPSPGDSSSSGIIPPTDSPTLIDIPRQSNADSSDAPTIVNFETGPPADAPTMVDLRAGNAADAPTLIDSVPSKSRAPRSQTFFTAPQPILSPGSV